MTDTLSSVEEISLIHYNKISDEQDENYFNLADVRCAEPCRQSTLSWISSNIRYLLERFCVVKLQQITQDHIFLTPVARTYFFKCMGLSSWNYINYKTSSTKIYLAKYSIFQKSTINRHTNSNVSTFQPHSKRFSVIHIDLTGCLQSWNGNNFCLTCIDQYTNRKEVAPLNNISVGTIAKAFYNN